jgi:hypothetical protein
MTAPRLRALLAEADDLCAAADRGDLSGSVRLTELAAELGRDRRYWAEARGLERLAGEMVVAGLTAKVRTAREQEAS